MVNALKRILNQKGLTLVEIIVTLAVLGIVIAPLMSMFVTSQKVNVESRKEYEAIQLAQKYMEEIKAMDTISIGNFNNGVYEENEGVGTFTWREESDDAKYDLIIKVMGSVDGGSVSEPPPVTYDFTESIDSDYTLNVISPLGYENIKIILERDNLDINVTNKASGHTVNLYIFSIEGENYAAKVNVTEGSVRVYKNEARERKPDNLLYNIEITVKRDTEEINTISGTTIFKYKPVKP